MIHWPNFFCTSHPVFRYGDFGNDELRLMNQIDADAFNEFERRGWAENSTEAYDRAFGPITRRVVDELLDAAGVVSQTRMLDLAWVMGLPPCQSAGKV